MKLKRLIIPAFSAAMICLLIQVSWIAGGPSFKASLSGPTLIGSQLIQIPFTDTTHPQPATYEIRGDLVAPLFWTGSLHITPDDCLERFTLNGFPLDIKVIPESKRCDWINGFDIDLEPYLHHGNNPVEIRLRNVAGNFGLRFDAQHDRAEFSLIGFAMAAFFFTAVLTFLQNFSLPCSSKQLTLAATALTIGVVLRFIHLFALHPMENFITSDMATYVYDAQSWAKGYFNIDQSLKPAGYAMILSLLIKLGFQLSAMKWLHLAAEIASMLLCWRATARWLGEKAGLVVLTVVAIELPIITLSGFFLAESFFTTWNCALFYLISLGMPRLKQSPRLMVAVGAVFELGFWFKGTNAFWGPIFGIILLSELKKYWKMPVERAVLLRAVKAYLLGGIVPALIYLVFSWAAFGVPAFSAPVGGLNLVEGKCAKKRNYDTYGSSWLSPLFMQIGETEEMHWPRPFWDQKYFWHEGMKCIEENPKVLLTSFRFDYYLFFGNHSWPPMTDVKTAPYEQNFERVLAPLLVLGLLLAIYFNRRFKNRLPFLFLIAILLNAWLFKSELRYRVPFDPILIALAVGGYWFAFLELKAATEMHRAKQLRPDERPIH